ncbi:MAG: glycosyltransferase, partial [Flavobacteriaceae bacterium]|nr:glycosyltransferase [Flavobacteriaceae bacterium]
MKLAIISHTEHYKTGDGKTVGWGPTVTEINNLLGVFEEIYHVAMVHEGPAPLSALPYRNKNIKFVPVNAVGGKGLKNKWDIIKHAPVILKTVKETLKKVDYFQFRAPTGIGVFVIPYLISLNKKEGWFKYAGNWKQSNLPISYRFQRWLLKKQNRKVTINGIWKDQPDHCLSFENPCLTVDEVQKGSQIRSNKQIDSKLNFCFVGRLENAKGVHLIINAINSLDRDEKQKIGQVNLVGDGKEASVYKAMTESSEIQYKFHGFLSRDEVH